jgi:transposase InsO family protein
VELLHVRRLRLTVDGGPAPGHAPAAAPARPVAACAYRQCPAVLMRTAGLIGISHRRKRGRHRPLPAPHEDLVRRRFVADAPDRLWATDVTEHPPAPGRSTAAQ